MLLTEKKLYFYTYKYSRSPLIRKLVIRFTNYVGRLGPSGKIVENSTILTSLEITGYRIKCYDFWNCKSSVVESSGVPKGGFGVFNPPPPPEIPNFDKVEPDCKLSGKCLVFLFQHHN
jgi:hypothetical protein